MKDYIFGNIFSVPTKPYYIVFLISKLLKVEPCLTSDPWPPIFIASWQENIDPDHLCLLWKIAACYFLLIIYSLFKLLKYSEPIHVHQMLKREYNSKRWTNILDFSQLHEGRSPIITLFDIKDQNKHSASAQLSLSIS